MDEILKGAAPQDIKSNGTNPTATTKPQTFALMKLKTYLTALRPWSLSGT
jgi:hypothetical protein